MIYEAVQLVSPPHANLTCTSLLIEHLDRMIVDGIIPDRYSLLVSVAANVDST